MFFEMSTFGVELMTVSLKQISLPHIAVIKFIVKLRFV